MIAGLHLKHHTQPMNNGDTTMNFLECSLLKTRSAVEQDADTEVPTFLCAEYSVLQWEDRHSRAGKDKVGLFPAWVEGKRAFMIRRNWCAGHGYTADGIHDTLITFEEGVKLLVEHGVYNFPAPSLGRKKS
jgi:hypothetical protein